VAIAAEPTTKPANPAVNEHDSSNLRAEEWKLTLLDDRRESAYRVRLPGTVQRASYGFLGIAINAGDSPPNVRQVVLGSGADQAGVHVNDKIVALGDLENPDAMAIQNFVRKHNPGERVRLKIERFGVPIELQVQLISDIDLARLLANSRSAAATTRPSR
jgi:C-terminal processing protease CtpA/Prc